jgi:membrane-associated phospholipid phosphatase
MTAKFSKFIAYFFHPINFPIIGALLYFMFIPRFIFKPQEYTILAVIFIGTYVFPVFLLLLLKRFGMIHSFHMHKIEERKFPTILFIAISYIIGNWLFKSSMVDLLSLLYFGYGIGLVFSYLLLYFKFKASLHTMAIGGLIGFLIYFSFHYKINIVILFSILFILSGFIGTSRLQLKAHKMSEVFFGYLIGLSTQFIVYFFYSI